MSKAKKIICILVSVILLCSLCVFSVSAETSRKTSFLTFTKARATDYSDSEFSSYYTLYPNNVNSPFGGIAQCFMLPQNVSDTTDRFFRGINANMYFDDFTFKKDVEYNISFKIFLPNIFLERSDGSVAYQLNDLSNMQVNLCDKNRKKRLSFVSQVKETYNSKDYFLYKFNKKWLNANLVTNTTQLYSFYECSATFTAGADFVGSFFNFNFNNASNLPSTHYYFGFSDLVLTYEYDGTQAVIDNNNENTDKLIEHDKEMHEQEKQETQQGGNDSVDGLTSVIPSDTDGVINSFSSLIDCMLYTGTDVDFKFPALKTPAIMGIPSYTLLEETPVNFKQIESIIPSAIMLTLRALLTIALIIFCFKELYSTISYVLTLKGGASE